MTDIVKPEVRSRMMSRIKGRNTKPEIAMRRALHRRGFRFRINVRGLPGSPDIVLPKWRTVLFVHGCFWHRHPGCAKATTPSSNVDFWLAKFKDNTDRDRRGVVQLLGGGWRVGIIWECAIGKIPDERLVDEVSRYVRGADSGLRVFE